jgi:hypothetical protein
MILRLCPPQEQATHERSSAGFQIFRERGKRGTQKRCVTQLQKRPVTDLPEREKGFDDPINLL